MTTTVNNKAEKPAKKRKTRSLDRIKARSGWIFVMPFLIGFIGIYLPIVFESIKSTFYNTKYVFVGWENYQKAFSEVVVGEETFVASIFNGLQQMVIDIPAILIFSLFMAVILNQKMAGRAVFRAIFFVPVILSTGIMASGFTGNMEGMGEAGLDDGAQNATEDIVSVMDVQMLFSNLMVGQGLAKYVTQLINNIFEIVNRSGVQMLIFLAGLQSISPAIYESCQIDGASTWETFWKITFPMISPMILVNAVYTIIDSFLTNSTMNFIKGANQQAGVTDAMYWTYFLVVIAILAVVSGLISTFVFYQRRD